MAGDLEKLNGTWYVTSVETDGRKMPAAAIGGASIVIDGDRFKSESMGAIYEGRVKLGRIGKQATFDLEFTAGHAAGTRHVGIYKLEKDRWTICLATKGSKRPTRFASRPGPGVVLETLERKAPRQAASKRAASAKRVFSEPALAPSGPVTDLEGEWQMSAGVFNGAAMSAEMVNWCRRVTRGNVTAVLAGPKVMLKATFTIDRSMAPATIDYANLEGTSKGKRQAGIFQMTGDALDICMAAPGKPRPRDFASASGDGRSFTSWRRLGR